MNKSKYSDCNNCPLLNQTMVLCDTNVPDDLKSVDLLILAEAPANEEIIQNKPLVGPAGKIFRECFEKSGLNEYNYFISNVVLCSNIIDGKTNNPPQHAIDTCIPNWNKFIEICEPRIISIMGNIPKNALKIKGNITQVRGTIDKYKNHDVFIMLHPSYIKRNGGLNSELGRVFYNDFLELKNILDKKLIRL